MNIPSRSSRHQAMRWSRASFDSAASALAACGAGADGGAGGGGGVAVSVMTVAIAPASARNSARFMSEPPAECGLLRLGREPEHRGRVVLSARLQFGRWELRLVR